ncbi:MAG TPA: hypothetical protein PLL69_00390 [Gemmatimonadales bacterium]|nr:hypothetical protein [Gemmatimonadales bacterium]
MTLHLPCRGRNPGAVHRIVVALLATVTLTIPARIAAQWRLEGWFGNALNLPSRLTIEQDGQPELGIDADWSTRPWRPTWYYSARVARWSGSSAWALEYMHHKLYLDNPTEEVPRFRITNGVNNLLVERHWRRRGWELGVGAGPAFAVPISTVRGKSYGQSKGVFGSRYEFAGGTLYGTVARRVKLLPYTGGSFALKTTLTYLDVSVAEGSARLTNLALHFQYGISFQSSP